MKKFLLGAAIVVVAAGAGGCGARTTTARSLPATGVTTTMTASAVAGSATATAAGSATIGPAVAGTAPPTVVGPRQLTVADNGATVRLARGQSVTVALAAGGMFSWHVPAASGAAVRQVGGSGGYPSSRPAQATFVATAPGTATLTAINDTACLHAHPRCLPPQQRWQVTVIVS